MALGSRWGARPAAPMAGLRAQTAGVPVTPVTVLDPDRVIETRIERLQAENRNVRTGFGTFAFPVAELPAPPAGQAYRIERMAIANLPNVGAISIMVGDLADRGTRDAVDNPTASMVVSDDPNGIYVPEAHPLYVVWFDFGADPNLYWATLQVCVEAV